MQTKKYGSVLTPLEGLSTTYDQIGGNGIVMWKQLCYGAHLEGPWNTVEYVCLQPGSSVGLHQHLKTEEIYYCISGEATVITNGIPEKLIPGTIALTRITDWHTLENRSTNEIFAMMVVEVFSETETPQNDSVIYDINNTTLSLEDKFSGHWRWIRNQQVSPGGFSITSSHDETVVCKVENTAFQVNINGIISTCSSGSAISIPVGEQADFTFSDSGQMVMVAVSKC